MVYLISSSLPWFFPFLWLNKCRLSKYDCKLNHVFLSHLLWFLLHPMKILYAQGTRLCQTELCLTLLVFPVNLWSVLAPSAGSVGEKILSWALWLAKHTLLTHCIGGWMGLFTKLSFGRPTLVGECPERSWLWEEGASEQEEWFLRKNSLSSMGLFLFERRGSQITY